jgi:hypothetical protein
MLRLVRRLLSRWELEVEAPTVFTGTYTEIAKELATDEVERARETLAEAQKLFQSVDLRAEGAERRATTLQGAVSVAATVAIAGATLLADPTKIHGGEWRVALALLFLGVVYCLVATAYRAAQASSQVHTWHFPGPQDVFGRLHQEHAAAVIALAADLFYCYARNTKIADWKVAYMRAAWQWFARALILLLALAAAITLYVAISINS